MGLPFLELVSGTPLGFQGISSKATPPDWSGTLGPKKESGLKLL